MVALAAMPCMIMVTDDSETGTRLEHSWGILGGRGSWVGGLLDLRGWKDALGQWLFWEKDLGGRKELINGWMNG